MIEKPDNADFYAWDDFLKWHEENSMLQDHYTGQAWLAWKARFLNAIAKATVKRVVEDKNVGMHSWVK